MRFSRFAVPCFGLALAACSSTGVPDGYPDDDQVIGDLEAEIAESLGPDVSVDVTQFRFVTEWSKDDYVGYRIVFGLDADKDINKTLPTTGEVFLMKEDDEVLGCEATAVYDRERTSDPWKLRGVLFTKPMCKSVAD
jgi:hypothetical protein